MLDTEDENASDNIKCQPVPEFKCEKDNGETEITLHFRNKDKADNFLEELKNPDNYVFLKNIEYPFEEYLNQKLLA